MYTPEEQSRFLHDGYCHVSGLLSADHLEELRDCYDTVWADEEPPISQTKLLKYKPFLELIEHPPLLDRHRAIFGGQVQLLQYDLLRYLPGSTHPERVWHRDLAFPGERPISINTIIYLEDMSEELGLTYVIPGSHVGLAMPPPGDDERQHQPMDGEVAVHAKAGDAVFINSAIWHSASKNRSPDRVRRTIYAYYGHWWLKRFEVDLGLPEEVHEDASLQRLQLLGLKRPDRMTGPDLHMYRPDVTVEVPAYDGRERDA